MTTADYTNERWHVDGEVVTHDDFPGSQWTFHEDVEPVETWANESDGYPTAHAARAWLAAQPKPALKVGMRIEATLRGGAVVTGEVTSVTECLDWTTVRIGPGVTCYLDVKPKHEAADDITDWHEVTA